MSELGQAGAGPEQFVHKRDHPAAGCDLCTWASNVDARKLSLRTCDNCGHETPNMLLRSVIVNTLDGQAPPQKWCQACRHRLRDQRLIERLERGQ